MDDNDHHDWVGELLNHQACQQQQLFRSWCSLPVYLTYYYYFMTGGLDNTYIHDLGVQIRCRLVLKKEDCSHSSRKRGILCHVYCSHDFCDSFAWVRD
jgi:hypothetical protein